jgi:hypothetical protein
MPSVRSIRLAIDGENGTPITLETTRSAKKLSSIVLSTLSLADDPRIDIVVTRASPIISADAVADVRRGLRSEFWPARLPTVPNRRR